LDCSSSLQLNLISYGVSKQTTHIPPEISRSVVNSNNPTRRKHLNRKDTLIASQHFSLSGITLFSGQGIGFWLNC
jgi:hypothetical protein